MNPSDLSRTTCLVVDDDPFMVAALCAQLQALGVGQVIHTTNAHDALRRLADRSQPIDIILTDLNMPHMDGIQLLRHLVALEESAGIILVSGEDPRLLESVRSLGEQQHLHIVGTLPKPISQQALGELLLRSDAPRRTSEDSNNTQVFAEELRQAIRNDELEFFFQPQVEMGSRRLVGVEALARWQHPQKGWIPSDMFVSLAEQYELIHELTDCIYHKAIDASASLQQQGLHTRVSINFSPSTLSALDLPDILSDALQRRGLSPSDVVVEVTESTLAQDMNIALDILTRLRLKGFGLSIDDFGTGFSSLEQLRHIPFTELKIDRCFVHDAAGNSASRAILESSIGLAHSLSLSCVAEGVETLEDWQLVQELGCDIVQGFYIAPPMPPAEMAQWAQDYALRHAAS
ncbi:EAL domain-containing protein [Pseudomaricurvus sp. HS19]|uniref:EAL domain-containing response regulator n=1 Tax=Pseudomaricurvus sp. HS19 TaxID=2692626 RepID=UPI0013718085|nr:EAL domain-containing response regulator [Pseudomaricurvus sp. HS19]MYM64268.1 EAL domain-containing protein [Pseudomaricurvus sp. HS19]